MINLPIVIVGALAALACVAAIRSMVAAEECLRILQMQQRDDVLGARRRIHDA